jgi:hypothetical protein
MNFIRNAANASQAIILGVVIVGCATATTITGHLTGSDLLVVLGVASGVTGGVTGAHVGANAAVNATAAAGSGSSPTVPAATVTPVQSVTA